MVLMSRTLLGTGASWIAIKRLRNYHSPLLSRRHGESLLAIKVVVPSGRTGSRGGCERGSEGEVEGGAGGFSTGSSGRCTLLV